MTKIYLTKEEIKKKAETILYKSLGDVISTGDYQTIENQISGYSTRRKGFLGELIEKYFFEINPGNKSEPDFTEAGVELKTTPLKEHSKYQYSSKERLVFSMINYDSIVNESWEYSSFLKKNKSLLLMFYLWTRDESILDYKFKFIHLLNLLEDISSEDVFQIKKDWEFIVNKIKRGEAHLLSEADTYYLGACTKAANSRVVRDQPLSRTPAKPRAFSFKQQYINYLVQSKLLGQKINSDSIFVKGKEVKTIDKKIKEKFAKYLGKTDKEILSQLNININNKAKSYKRLIVNKILGIKTKNIEELEKANVTLKVITLEHTGTLKESISFPSFDYKDLVAQVWYDDESETMSDFHLQLETKRFLFVVFQKQKNSEDIILKKIVFWNFPMGDIGEAEKVWQKTIDCINEGRYTDLPKITENKVAHVRPHGKNGKDKIKTPQGTLEMKKSFWLNAKYIQNAIETDKSNT